MKTPRIDYDQIADKYSQHRGVVPGVLQRLTSRLRPTSRVLEVELIFDLPENQPHRADLAKMLVRRRARRQGLGAALMWAAEVERLIADY